MKKVLTLGLVVLFGTALLAGCAKKEEVPAPAEQPVVVEETPAPMTETTTETTTTETTTETMTETPPAMTPPPAN